MIGETAYPHAKPAPRRLQLLHWWQERRERKAAERKRRASVGYRILGAQMAATKRNARKQNGWVG